MYLKQELYRLIKTDESIFDFIQESALDGLWYWDLQNPEHEWMNAKFWTVLGYNPDEMPHKSSAWQSIINQDDLKLANENFSKHCANPNHPYDQIVRYTHKDGSTLWIRCRGLAIRDKSGKPIRMLGAHQDVTASKRSEQELFKAKEKAEESKEKYRLMYNNAPLPYQSLDENGCFIDINPMWLKTLGYERDEVIGKWYGDFLHPDFVEHFRINFPAFKKRGYVSDVQFKLRRKDKTYIYVSFEGCVGYTPEGSFKQTYCVFKDITEQKALENAIIAAKEKAEESEEKFRGIFESHSAAIAIIEADTTISMVNDSYCKLSGYAREEVIGMSWTKQIPPDDLERLKEYNRIRQLNPAEAPSEYEFTFYHRNGEIKQAMMSVGIMPDKKRIIASFIDISQRKHVEEALKEKNRDLAFLNSLSFKLAAIDSHEHIYKVALEEIYKHTGATIALISEYFSDGKYLQVREIKSDSAVLTKLTNLIGNKIKNTKSFLNDENYNLIIKQNIGVSDNLVDVSFGAIPSIVDVAIRKALGLKTFWGIAHKISGKLYGTCLLAFKSERISFSHELFESFAQIVSLSIRRKLAEKELIYAKEKAEESEEKYRLLHENAGIGIGYHSPDGIVLSYNQIAAKNMNGNPEDFVGKSIFDLFPKDAADFYFNRIQNAINSSQPLVYEDLIHLPTEDRWFISTYARIENLQQKVLGIQIISQDVTKIKTSEIELQKAKEKAEESEAKLSTLFSAMSEMVVLHELVFDERGKPINYRVTDCNDAFTRITGISRNAAVGRLSTEVYSAERPPYLKEYSDVVLIGEPFNLEVYFQPMDKHFSITAMRLENNRFATITADVTERKHSEKQIIEAKEKAEESEAKFRKTIEFSPIPMVVANNNGDLIFLNKQFIETFGYTIEELVSIQKWFELVYPDIKYRNSVITQWNSDSEFAIKNNVPTTAREYLVTCKNGDVKTIENTVYLTKEFSIGLFLDITERKLAEVELVLAKEKAEENEMILKEQKNEILFNNERLESLLKVSQLQTNSVQELLDFALKQAVDLTKSKIGYIYFYVEEKKQFILNTWSKDVMKECTVMNPQTVYDLDKTGCWGEAVRQRKPIIINDYHAENPIKKGTPEGHVKLEKFLTIPVIFDNKIVAVAGVANKSTNYNSSDVRQLTLLMDNVWKISERLVLIKDLRLAKEKAEESDRLKSAFLANMSHEIRTPMNGIMGFSELLKSSDLSGEQQKSYIEIIEKSGKRMLNIINDIMSISKIESGTMDIHLKETNINNQLQFVYDVLKFDAGRKKLSLSYNYKITDKEAIFITDTEKFYGILSNLVNNAIKYTDSGTIEYGYINKGKEFEFYVKDTGIGIPKDRQEAIFERFIQADIADTMARQGAGLGLAISRAYVAMLGGKIWVESEDGKGSTFYFTLPSNSESAHEYNDHQHTNAEIDKDVRKLKILIAEDDDDSLLLMKETVSIWGKEIIAVSNGVKAIEVCRSNPDIDLILMDIRMPDMGGYEATVKIREFNKAVIIIAQTAYAQAGDREKAIDVGCNDYIAKPIRVIELQALIEKYFGK